MRPIAQIKREFVKVLVNPVAELLDGCPVTLPTMLPTARSMSKWKSRAMAWITIVTASLMTVRLRCVKNKKESALARPNHAMVPVDLWSAMPACMVLIIRKSRRCVTAWIMTVMESLTTRGQTRVKHAARVLANVMPQA